MAVITISRQYGSGGDAVAHRVCEILGYDYFDKQMMAHVATEVGLSKHEIIDFKEENYKVRGFLDRLFGRSRVVAEVENWKEDESIAEKHWVADKLNEEQCINLVRSTIMAAYKRGNVVIIGRGGQAILKEMPSVLHVRIEATLGSRVMRIQKRENISLAEAEALVRQHDQSAAAYLKRFYDIDWGHTHNYHLTVNTTKWDLDAVVQILVSAVSHLRMVEE